VALTERLVAALPEWPDVLYVHGAALYRADRFQQSIKQLIKAVKADPEGKNAEYRLFLAMAYNRLGNHAEAERWLREAERFLRAPGSIPANASANDHYTALSNEVLRDEAKRQIGPNTN
jgi:tetratricopeptide (TPR) repeat protein